MRAPAPDYEHEADLTLERLLTGGTSSFKALVGGAKGRFPTEVLQFLQNQRSNPNFNAAVVEAMILEAQTSGPAQELQQGKGLALPHPVDSEWRFTEGTAEKLLSLAIAATDPGDLILLVGVPSVALAAARRQDDRLYWVRGEQNIITDGVMKATAADGRFRHQVAGELKAAAAILDPPWYFDQFRGMLSLVASLCRPGARIFASTPGEHVRPGIKEDVVRITESAIQSGLELESQEAAALEYRTPLFEINALRATGLTAWLPDWRRGSLAIYRKRSCGIAWPLGQKVPAFELTLSGVRLRLLGWDDDSTFEISPVDQGEIFPSVSMRAPRRAKGALWTSGNRAFSAPKRLTLAAMLEIAVEHGLLPKGLETELSTSRNRYSIDAVRPLIQKLTNLAEREFAEAASVVGSAAWETSANDARFLNV